MTRMGNQGDRRFIKRDVYTKYFRYTAKMEGYTKFVYTAKLGDDIRSIVDIQELGDISRSFKSLKGNMKR